MAKSTETQLLEGTGLTITGVCHSRSRRQFESNGKKRFNIQLNFLTAHGMVPVERWSDTPLPSDTPAVGERVTLPITLQHYQGKNGKGVRLCWGAVQDEGSF